MQNSPSVPQSTPVVTRGANRRHSSNGPGAGLVTGNLNIHLPDLLIRNRLLFELGADLREEYAITSTVARLEDVQTMAHRLGGPLRIEISDAALRVTDGTYDKTVPRAVHFEEATDANILCTMIGEALAIKGGVSPADQKTAGEYGHAFQCGFLGKCYQTQIAHLRRLQEPGRTVVMLRARHVEVAATLRAAFGLDHVPTFAEATGIGGSWECVMIRRSPVDELFVVQDQGWTWLLYPERDLPDLERTGRTSINHAVVKARLERKFAGIKGLASPADTWALYRYWSYCATLRRGDVPHGVCIHWPHGPNDLVLPHSYPTPESEAADLAVLIGKVLLGGPEHGFTCDPDDPGYQAACAAEQAMAEAFAEQWLTGARIESEAVAA